MEGKRRDSTGEREIPDSGPSARELCEGSDTEIDHIQVRVSDAGGNVLKPEQPVKGWEEAEQALAGYSKTNAKKTPQSLWNYKNKAKRVKEDAANALLKREYGNISRLFTSPAPKPSPKTGAPMARQQLPPLPN